eukprot:scaffold1942_cov351-Prasinococcus_capsulatus_cf.AAC.4
MSSRRLSCKACSGNKAYPHTSMGTLSGDGCSVCPQLRLAHLPGRTAQQLEPCGHLWGARVILPHRRGEQPVRRAHVLRVDLLPGGPSRSCPPHTGASLRPHQLMRQQRVELQRRAQAGAHLPEELYLQHRLQRSPMASVSPRRKHTAAPPRKRLPCWTHTAP